MLRPIFIEITPTGESATPVTVNVDQITKISGTMSAKVEVLGADPIDTIHSYDEVRALIRPFSTLIGINGEPLV